MELILFLISYAVFLSLCRKKNPWGLIVLYWAAVCAKNFMEGIT